QQKSTLTNKPARSAAQPCAQLRNQKPTSPNRATLRAVQVTPACGADNRKTQDNQNNKRRAAQHRLRAAQEPEAAENAVFNANA
ncbi:hypothetical protein A2U01_0084813, partial [Trifolium medium]|nr:hypothetical protein [Trifolium medium]